MKNGALVPDASGELDAKVHWRNGEAAFAELELLLMHDALLVCAPGAVYLRTHNGYELVAFGGASPQTNDGTGLVAFFGTALQTRRGTGLVVVAAANLQVSNRTGLVAFDGASLRSSDGPVGADGAFLWRSDELELGASGEASLQKNSEVGVLSLDDFDKYPQSIDLVDRSERLAEVMAGVAMELSATDAGGDDYEPVVVPDAS